MRASDMYLVLLGAISVFGAVAIFTSGVAWGALPLVLGGLLMLGWAGKRAAHNPRLLAVGFSTVAHDRFLEDLDVRGFDVRECPGPGKRDCPVHRGEPCPYGNRSHVSALIHRDAGSTGALPPCGPALGIPALYVVEGSNEPASYGNRRGRIGENRGLDEMIAAIAEVGVRMSRQEVVSWAPQGRD